MFIFNFKTSFKACIFLLIALCNNFVFAQTYNFNNKEEVINRLRNDISALCNDSMQGRETGTAFEKIAYNYIISQYKQIGLQTIMPENSYLQSFEFSEGFKVKDSTFLTIKNKEYELNTDFFPTHYTTSKEVSGELIYVGYGISAPDLKYDDYEGKDNLKDKIFVMEMSNPDGFASQKFSKYYKLDKKINLAKEKGAIAVILINTDKDCPDLSNETDLKNYDLGMPVIFMNKKHAAKLIKLDGDKVSLKTAIEKNKKTGYNVVGYIDNKAEKTIIIGAHYDHLGMGKFGSRYQGTPQIHNGADDNASGIAGLFELSKYFKLNKIKRNIIIVAFSGEEKGLYGSAYFAKSKDYDISKIDYMLNLDMLGRMDKSVVIIGTGTTPVWDTLIKQIKIDDLKTRTSKSGIGGSDHSSFYLKNIPVLFFFAGSHDDYHKPTDDIEKINFNGEFLILHFVKTLVEATDTIEKFPFVATVDKNQSTTRNGNGIGVIPDHSYDGKGFRIEGVLNGKQAQIAGFKAGDIIIKINNNDVIDIYSYMKLLNTFKKGEKIKISVLRNDKAQEFEIEL